MNFSLENYILKDFSINSNIINLLIIKLFSNNKIDFIKNFNKYIINNKANCKSVFAIDISNIIINTKNLKEIINMFYKNNILLLGIFINHNQRDIISNISIQILNNFYKKKLKIFNENKSLIINNIIRSGQKIYSKNKDIIIIGSVPSGAEILSNNNIHIYGTLYGKAYAGINGNNDSYIFCSAVKAELISISNTYLLYENIPIKYLKKPLYFNLKNNKILINTL